MLLRLPGELGKSNQEDAGERYLKVKEKLPV